MAIGAARQRNAVSEGMALGLCMLERYEFHFDKLRVDLAFENAWRDWPDRYKTQFRHVRTDLRNGTDACLGNNLSRRRQTNTCVLLGRERAAHQHLQPIRRLALG
jgi:hypothetical protein